MNRWPEGNAIHNGPSGSLSKNKNPESSDSVSPWKLQQLDLSILLRSDDDKLVLLRRYEEQARILKINSGKQFLACIRGEWMQGSFVVLENSDGHVPWVNLPDIIFSPAGTRQDHHPSGHKFKERNGWEGLWEILRSPTPPSLKEKT